MSVRVALFIVSYIVMVVSNLAAMQCIALMTDDVNRGRSATNLLWPFGWQRSVLFGLSSRERPIVDAFRAAHPNGKIYRYWQLSRGGGIVGGLGMFGVFVSFLR